MNVNRDQLEAKIMNLQKMAAYSLPTTWGDVSVEGRASKKQFAAWAVEAGRMEALAGQVKRLLDRVVKEES